MRKNFLPLAILEISEQDAFEVIDSFLYYAYPYL